MGNRRKFLKKVGLGASALSLSLAGGTPKAHSKEAGRPNILFCIADDWGWPHAGKYGDTIVRTPTFNRLTDEGVMFEYAYVSSPSCTPSRNSLLAGQFHWRLGEGASLRSTLDVNIPVYPLLLEQEGYHVGHWRKCWGPGVLEPGGYVDKHPGGKQYPGGFRQFLDARPEGTPFCFWLGASDPHRPYEKGSGKASGINIDAVDVPGFYPDEEEIRSDIADYYYEVERFDRDCGEAVRLLEEAGELDTTIIVMTGDNGIPFPRCKSNIYDMGVRVPLVVRWGAQVNGSRVVKDFVSLTDLAPTFLDVAGCAVPRQMTGRSLLPLLQSGKEGRIEPERDHVLFGKERHVPAQLAPSLDGYPCRGIRTERYLYIRNFAPDRWPAGVHEGGTHPMRSYADCDNSPTKSFLVEHRNDPRYRRFYELSFARRPSEELYDLSKDPDQLNNVAENSGYEKIRNELSKKLMSGLKATADPRVIGGGEMFDQYPYRAPYDLHTKP